MDRRDFLKNSALILAGASVESPLGWVRRLFTTGGWQKQGLLYQHTTFTLGFLISTEMAEDDWYEKYIDLNQVMARHLLSSGVDPSMRVLSPASREAIKTLNGKALVTL